MSAERRRLRGRVAIVGAAESDELGKLPHKSALALHAEGAFKGKSASNYVANVLNMGRATVYKHLKELKG